MLYTIIQSSHHLQSRRGRSRAHWQHLHVADLCQAPARVALFRGSKRGQSRRFKHTVASVTVNPILTLCCECISDALRYYPTVDLLFKKRSNYYTDFYSVSSVLFAFLIEYSHCCVCAELLRFLSFVSSTNPYKIVKWPRSKRTFCEFN